jgi:hypothetical protein
MRQPKVVQQLRLNRPARRIDVSLSRPRTPISDPSRKLPSQRRRADTEACEEHPNESSLRAEFSTTPGLRRQRAMFGLEGSNPSRSTE